jgi:hypothetical protein
MIFSFLQRRNPPILPSLQKMPDDKKSVVNGKLSPFADDVDAIRSRGNDNKESLAELLFAFFRHYGYEFPYSTSVVSIREGRMVSRNEKGWDDYVVNKEARCRLCVEEPFNTERNLGNSADDYAWNGIHREIRRAFEFLADGDRRPNPNLHSLAVRRSQAGVKIRSRIRALAKREAIATSLHNALEIGAPAAGRHSTTTNEEVMCRVRPWGSMRSITLLPRAICTTTCSNSTNFFRRNRML